MLEAQATFEDGGQRPSGKVVDHENAAHEKRNWVRLTSYCNNRCTFCLDSAAHNGTFGSRLLIRDQIIRGRKDGATRLILSGGEPTIHPHYVEFIALGQSLGYRRIQTVTNGRMFSYPEFLGRCLDAGLGEITFSIHGHNAKIHDALVGVKGAFDEEVAGLQATLADGRAVVNVDVCLNRGNIKHLPELLDNFIGMGVREFDLLHIIPFGRAYEEGKDTLFYDIDEAMPSIRYALELSQRPDLHIWFNRFPPPFLEGFEHLIQDPYKLNDEVRGRREEYERLLATGQPLSCRQPDRCNKCYLRELCDTLDATRDGIAHDDYEVYRVHLRDGATPPPAPPGRYASLWIDAPDFGRAATAFDLVPQAALILDLESYDDFDPARLGGRMLARAYASRPQDVDRLLALTDAEVFVVLDRTTAAHLLQHLPAPPPRLGVALPTYERLTEAKERHPDLRAFFAAYPEAVPVEGVTACIAGRQPLPPRRILDADVLDEGGRLEVFGYTRRFILDHFFTKSRRCGTCVHAASCPGAHINFVRSHGYAALQPIVA